MLRSTDVNSPCIDIDRLNRPALSRRKKCLFALLATVGFFAILEISLTAFGVGDENAASDPLVGFSNQIPLMQVVTDDNGMEILQTAPSKLVWFNHQEFPRIKPPSTRRVFCVGGSTTFGRPFHDLTSFPGWLRELLPHVAAENHAAGENHSEAQPTWEVINAGGVSYASYRVAAVVEELSQYEPDLYVVYTGQNEFLEQRTYAGLLESSALSRNASAILKTSRVFSLASSVRDAFRGQAETDGPAEMLSGEVDERLNHTPGPSDYHRDDQWHDKVNRDFEYNLRRMIEIARRSGADIVFVTPTSNELDCTPFKSAPADELDEVSIQDFDREIQLADSYLASRNHQQALAACDQALVIDPRNPDAHHMRGRILFAMNRYDEAQASLARAIDEDICPLRATSTLRATLRRVVDEASVPLVDFESLLRQKSRRDHGHACLGETYFLDHVHPDVETHRQLALWILETLLSESIVEGRLPSDEKVRMVAEKIESQIDRKAQAVSLRNLAKVLHWSGKYNDAMRSARDALEISPNDLECHYIISDCLLALGRTEKAFESFEELFAIGDYPRAYLPYGELLATYGQWKASKPYLLQAIVETQGVRQARAYWLLGAVHMQLGEYEFALESYQESDRVYPDYAPTILGIANALLALDRTDEALEMLLRANRLEPGNSEVETALMLLGEPQ